MLRLVSDNTHFIKAFDDYVEAVDFMSLNLKSEMEKARALPKMAFARFFTGLCKKHIECHEDNNGKCRYKVRIKR